VVEGNGLMKAVGRLWGAGGAAGRAPRSFGREKPLKGVARKGGGACWVGGGGMVRLGLVAVAAVGRLWGQSRFLFWGARGGGRKKRRKDDVVCWVDRWLLPGCPRDLLRLAVWDYGRIRHDL